MLPRSRVKTRIAIKTVGRAKTWPPDIMQILIALKSCSQIWTKFKNTSSVSLTEQKNGHAKRFQATGYAFKLQKVDKH